MIIDSHCHLSHFSDDEIYKIISTANQNGIKILHDICININDINKLLKISFLYDCVYSSIGIHPLDISIEMGNYINIDELLRFTKNKKIISVGETGLDFYKSNNKKNQKKNFILHIEVSRITGLPLIIHSRNADYELIDILKLEMKNKPFSGVIHSFSSSKDLAYKAIDLGIYISFSGIITFKNSESLRKIARDIPHDYVLVETDSPYLSPEPYRGRKNKPEMLKYIIDCLAKIWIKTPKNTAEITTKNFLKLFNKVKLNNEKL